MQGKLEFLMRPMRNNLTTELLRGAGALLAVADRRPVRAL